MSEASKVDEILGKAKEEEKQYEWLKAAEHYQEALKVVADSDSLGKGEICESLGYAFYRSAMQAENRDWFKEQMQQAIGAYWKAHENYEKLMDERKTARLFRCESVVKYFGYWLTSDPSERKELLNKCLDSEDKALTAFLKSGEILEYGKTYYQLSLVLYLRTYLEWDRRILKNIVDRGMQWGERVIPLLSKMDESHLAAEVCFTSTVCMDLFDDFFVADPTESDRIRSKSIQQLGKAVNLSEKSGDAQFQGLAHLWLGNILREEEAVEHFEKALECGRLTRDDFLIGMSLDYLAHAIRWRASATEDPERRKDLTGQAMRFYNESQNYHSIMSFMNPRIGGMTEPAESYWTLATWEVDPEKRLELLEKSERAGTEALSFAQASNMPIVTAQAFHVASKTLEARARMEPEELAKKNYLERALKYREKIDGILEPLMPFNYAGKAAWHNCLAEIKTDLADIERDPNNRRRLLEEAGLSMEKCLEMFGRIVPLLEKIGGTWQYASLRTYEDNYATLLLHLYDSTKKTEHLRKAILVSQEAIESAGKLDLVSRMAESFWKIAKAQANLEEHAEAAESFRHASEGFEKAAEKIPQLKIFYSDLASYMQAWSEIEKARYHHARQEYGQAMEHFEKAARLHESLKRWSYLAPNYLAWVQLENAEELSGNEQSEDAIKAFNEAAGLFSRTRESLQAQALKTEDPYEQNMVTGLAKASEFRREYCLGRRILEEARILDKKGDHSSSSEKYGKAAEKFDQITKVVKTDQEKKELELITTLSLAWQKMTQAEAETSPALYSEAAQLFEKAKELSPTEKTKMLALGHSRFCKALEAGAKFTDTRDMMEHSRAMKHLEIATSYYLKADFQSASEYTKATRFLFDAYVHMGDAARETDPEKKTRLYTLAQKLLQASADSYAKANSPSRREQALKLLETANEQRELAFSLAEVLHAPIMTSTIAFATPSPTSEKATGLERFEHAEVNANLIFSRKELRVGESVDLEIELANPGKGQALLTQIEEAFPESFDLTTKPELYRVEGHNINMKGKRLDPLKTEEVKFSVKPKRKGSFTVRPRILYIDENGNAKSHQPEPVTITVKELGIKGWIAGDT